MFTICVIEEGKTGYEAIKSFSSWDKTPESACWSYSGEEIIYYYENEDRRKEGVFWIDATGKDTVQTQIPNIDNWENVNIRDAYANPSLNEVVYVGKGDKTTRLITININS